jgi:hypothetical protein
MLELMGDESPTYDRIRFICTAPQADGTPWLQLPSTYHVQNPTIYFTTDIKVRHDNMLTRASWAMAFQSAKANPGTRKSGEDDADRAASKAGPLQASTALVKTRFGIGVYAHLPVFPI